MREREREEQIQSIAFFSVWFFNINLFALTYLSGILITTSAQFNQ